MSNAVRVYVSPTGRRSIALIPNGKKYTVAYGKFGEFAEAAVGSRVVPVTHDQLVAGTDFAVPHHKIIAGHMRMVSDDQLEVHTAEKGSMKVMYKLQDVHRFNGRFRALPNVVPSMVFMGRLAGRQEHLLIVGDARTSSWLIYTFTGITSTTISAQSARVTNLIALAGKGISFKLPDSGNVQVVVGRNAISCNGRNSPLMAVFNYTFDVTSELAVISKV